MKRNGMCPICYLRKMFLGAKTVAAPVTRESYENDVQKTPLMGWSSWNTFRNRIDESLIYETALAMKESGLADAGYKFVNLDDCWQSSMRDGNGDLQGDLTTFSEGIPTLIKKINTLGLKVGLYASNGTLTCEDLPASLHREKADALTLARWGAEYFKYDFCHNERIPSYAPLVYAITIAEIGKRESKSYECSNAVLKGLARRMKCKKLPGGQYVSGLDAGKGAILFENVFAEKDGEYALTIDIKKKGDYEKYLCAKINGGEVYAIEFPPQKFFNLTARFQTVVNLKKGANSIELYNPVAKKRDSEALQYQKMARCLKEATLEVASAANTPEKPILFSICEWGWGKPWLWGASAGNMWRTTPDIRPIWPWIKIIYERTVKLQEYSSPGHFNDPDMLEVGNGKLTYNQNLSHFALWCMMCAPLVLGNDLRKMPKPILDIVTNKDLIAINQDARAIQAKRVKKGTVDVLAKPLSDGATAICFFNKAPYAKTYRFNASILRSDNYVAMPKGERDVKVIIGECAKQGDKLTAKIDGHGVTVIII